ncbi:MAG: PLP-dependent transferase [Clostridia bacterium]|nr:PLP-dependent transferase [Clostridia bacterium]
MTTPIVDFVRKYNDQKSIRMHMPGHKGKSLLGYEPFDLTEIDGADNLYCPNGIIEESENNASSIFGCDTYYSTEGSSLCIRSMLYIAMTSRKTSTRPVVLAGRNAHKTFISAAALLDFDIEWIYPKDDDVYYSGKISSQDIDDKLSSMHTKPVAVYITTPDYLGNIVDVKSISIVCKKHGVLLLVDNAHGAYLKFLDKSIHPMDLGANICCDSAHKTMNVITGGAYLHVSADMKISKRTIKEAMGRFESTSPK